MKQHQNPPVKFVKLWRSMWVRGSSRGSQTEHSDKAHNGRASNQTLERELYGWQIFMIAFSGIIGGVVLFSTNGQFIQAAGPSGFFAALAYVATTSICVSEGLGEMVVQWPISNAMVEYVKVFVDEDLALVVGIAYWYTWASIVFTMLIGAAELTQFWNLATVYQTLAFYVGTALAILGINWFGVRYYGIVEGIAGVLKAIFVFGAGIFLYVVGHNYGSTYIAKGVTLEYDTSVAHSKAVATLLIIPYLTYGFIGIEMVAVTAFEARKPRKDLRFTARYISWIIVTIFFFIGIADALNVAWTDLPFLESRSEDPKVDLKNSLRTASELVAAALDAGYNILPGFFNGCLVFCLLSAANTALYIASRTLYGLMQGLLQGFDHKDSNLKWVLGKVTVLDPRTRVPFFCLVISLISFCWLPVLHHSTKETFLVMSTIGSVGGVFVWASQCLAYIRYYHWSEAQKDFIQASAETNAQYKMYDRWSSNTQRRYWGLLGPTQPIPAYIGLVLCVLVVFVLGSATFWDTKLTATKFAAAYSGPIFLIILYISLKIWRFSQGTRTLWIKFDGGSDQFQDVLDQFHHRLYLRDADTAEDDHSSVQSSAHSGVQSGAAPVQAIETTHTETPSQWANDVTIGIGQQMERRSY